MGNYSNSIRSSIKSVIFLKSRPACQLEFTELARPNPTNAAWASKSIYFSDGRILCRLCESFQLIFGSLRVNSFHFSAYNSNNPSVNLDFCGLECDLILVSVKSLVKRVIWRWKKEVQSKSESTDCFSTIFHSAFSFLPVIAHQKIFQDAKNILPCNSYPVDPNLCAR